MKETLPVDPDANHQNFIRNTLEMIQDRIGGVRYYEKIDQVEIYFGISFRYYSEFGGKVLNFLGERDIAVFVILQ